MKYASCCILLLLFLAACVGEPTSRDLPTTDLPDSESGEPIVSSTEDEKEEQALEVEVSPKPLYPKYGLLISLEDEELFLDPNIVYPLLNWNFPLIIRRSIRRPPLEYLLYLSDGQVFVREVAENSAELLLLPPANFNAELPTQYAEILPGAELENNVLYGMSRGEDGPELSLPLLRFTPAEDPVMLKPTSPVRLAISQSIPRWLPLLGGQGYEVELRGESQPLIRVETQRNRLSSEDFEALYGREGEYEYRIRPLQSAGEGWSAWTPFSTSGSMIFTDDRPLDYYDFTPGIGAEDLVARPAGDERLPPEAGAQFAIVPGRLPSFFPYELSNAQALSLLNAGLEEGSLSPGGDGPGNVTLEHAGITVLGLSGLYYGLQFGLELNTAEDGSISLSALPGYADHPVTGITWFGALYLANRFSLELGMEPVYALDRLQWDREKKGVRLPTEMEWELYARLNEGSLNSATANYLRSGDPWEDITYPHNRNGGPTTPVNWNGNHLLGNVWEWCWDWYDEQAYERYASLFMPTLAELTSNLTDAESARLFTVSPNDEESIFQRTLRGGAWNSPEQAIRLTNRGQFYWDEASWSVGVRFVVDRD